MASGCGQRGGFGLELRTNMGSSRIINFTKSKIANAQHSFGNNLSIDLYSDGTAANQINGMQALVADAGTGTVGGINSATFTFWQNVVQSAAAPLQRGSAITPSATTIESLMLPLWIRPDSSGRHAGSDRLLGRLRFTFYEQSQTKLKRYAPEDNGKGGMVSMKYKTADVFFDSSGGIPAAHMYFLNTDYMELLFLLGQHGNHGRTQVRESGCRRDPDPVARNVVVSNRSLQGVLKA